MRIVPSTKRPAGSSEARCGACRRTAAGCSSATTSAARAAGSSPSRSTVTRFSTSPRSRTRATLTFSRPLRCTYCAVLIHLQPRRGAARGGRPMCGTSATADDLALVVEARSVADDLLDGYLRLGARQGHEPRHAGRLRSSRRAPRRAPARGPPGPPTTRRCRPRWRSSTSTGGERPRRAAPDADRPGDGSRGPGDDQHPRAHPGAGLGKAADEVVGGDANARPAISRGSPSPPTSTRSIAGSSAISARARRTTSATSMAGGTRPSASRPGASSPMGSSRASAETTSRRTSSVRPSGSRRQGAVLLGGGRRLVRGPGALVRPDPSTTPRRASSATSSWPCSTRARRPPAASWTARPSPSADGLERFDRVERLEQPEDIKRELPWVRESLDPETGRTSALRRGRRRPDPARRDHPVRLRHPR